MGNVMAAAPLAPPAPSVVPPPVFDDRKQQATADKNELRNPGTVEDIHKKCKEVFPMAFEGARLIVNKGLSNHFQISHTVHMSSIMPSGYRFGATYVGTNLVGQGESYPVLLGDIDPNGNLNANILHLINSRTKAKIVAQIQESRMVNNQITTDYRGDTFTTSLTLGQIDLVNGAGIGVLQYLKAVSPTVDLGAEVAYQHGPNIPGGGMAAVSAVGRYTLPDSVVSATLSSGRINLCYYHKGMENMQIGVEVESDFRARESSATFGYQMEVPKANMTFKGSVDSNWQVSAVMEKRLAPLPFTFLLSGHIVHGTSKPTYRFGTGLLLG